MISDSVLGTIYEDVANLQERVALLENVVVQLQTGGTVLDVNTNLDTLGIGTYIIPSASVCSSLLNKPISSNATGFIKVIQGGIEGQLIMYYVPCSKEGASYYQRAFYENTWGSWHDIDVFDSGWIDLTLNTGVLAFNEEQKPRYRRIGKEVFITGVVKNISANETVIATLPTNYRPSKKIIIAVPSTSTKFSRISVLTTGAINYEQMNEGTPATSNWHSVACSFNVD